MPCSSGSGLITGTWPQKHMHLRRGTLRYTCHGGSRRFAGLRSGKNCSRFCGVLCNALQIPSAFRVTVSSCRGVTPLSARGLRYRSRVIITVCAACVTPVANHVSKPAYLYHHGTRLPRDPGQRATGPPAGCTSPGRYKPLMSPLRFRRST